MIDDDTDDEATPITFKRDGLDEDTAARIFARDPRGVTEDLSFAASRSLMQITKELQRSEPELRRDMAKMFTRLGQDYPNLVRILWEASRDGVVSPKRAARFYELEEA